MSNQKSNKIAPHIRLKELRTMLGLKQFELAEKVGMSQAAYHRLESGERSFSIDSLILFSNYFGISPDYFLEIDDDKKENNFVFLPDYLMKRIKYEAKKNSKTVEKEVIDTLQRIYPDENKNIVKIFDLFCGLDQNEKAYIIDLFEYMEGRSTKRPIISDYKKIK